MSLLILCQSPIDSRFLLVSFANVKEGSWLIRLVVRRLGRETESWLAVVKRALNCLASWQGDVASLQNYLIQETQQMLQVQTSEITLVWRWNTFLDGRELHIMRRGEFGLRPVTTKRREGRGRGWRARLPNLEISDVTTGDATCTW